MSFLYSILFFLLIGCNKEGSDFAQAKIEIEKLRLENENLKMRSMLERKKVSTSGQRQNAIQLKCEDGLIYKKIIHPDDSTRTREICVDKDGLAQGKFKNYYFMGNLQADGNFIDGKMEGEFTSYHPDGNVEIKKNYKNDSFEGEILEYSMKGDLKKRLLAKGNMLNGKALHYHRNGKIEASFFYLNNKVEGEAIHYYDSGKFEKKEFFKDNKLEGEVITYYENEKIKEKVQFKNNQKEGEAITYNENGEIKEKLFYRNNELVDLVAEASNSEENGAVNIKKITGDPSSFIDKKVKLYGYIQLSTYFNYGYRDARDSHFSFRFSHDKYFSKYINVYLEKGIGRKFFDEVTKTDEEWYGPVTLVLTNLRSRYDKNSPEMWEALLIEKDINSKLNPEIISGPYKLTDHLKNVKEKYGAEINSSSRNVKCEKMPIKDVQTQLVEFYSCRDEEMSLFMVVDKINDRVAKLKTILTKKKKGIDCNNQFWIDFLEQKDPPKVKERYGFKEVEVLHGETNVKVSCSTGKTDESDVYFTLDYPLEFEFIHAEVQSKTNMRDCITGEVAEAATITATLNSKKASEDEITYLSNSAIKKCRSWGSFEEQQIFSNLSAGDKQALTKFNEVMYNPKTWRMEFVNYMNKSKKDKK